MSRKRNYQQEYDNYHSVGPHRIGHAFRLRARRIAEIEGLSRPHDGYELHHINVDPTDNSIDNMVFLDSCTHRLLHGQHCSEHEKQANPTVVYAGPESWLRCSGYSDLLREAHAPAAARPAAKRSKCKQRLDSSEKVFVSRLRHVLKKCRKKGAATCHAKGPAYKTYRQLGKKARVGMTRRGVKLRPVRGKA